MKKTYEVVTFTGKTWENLDGLEFTSREKAQAHLETWEQAAPLEEHQIVTRGSKVRKPAVKIHRFREHNLVIKGEEKDLRYIAEMLRDAEGTVGDLRYQIEYAFDIDGVRSMNEEEKQ